MHWGETLDGCHGGDAGCLAPHKVGAVLLSEEDHRKPATVDLSLIEAEGIGGEESGDFFHLEFLDKRLGFSLHGYDVADVIHRGGKILRRGFRGLRGVCHKLTW